MLSLRRKASWRPHARRVARLLSSAQFTRELPAEPRSSTRGAARECLIPTPYEPHMTLYTNLLDRAKVDDGSRPMFGTRTGSGGYTWRSFDEFLEHVAATSSGLQHAVHVERQEPVGVFSRTRYEWTLVEQSCNRMSYALVPLYDTLGASTVPYILNHTQMRVVCCGKTETAALLRALPECPHLRFIVQFESEVDAEQKQEAEARGVELWTLDELVAVGKDHPADADPPKPEDVSTICYTSGTTGTPKGVLVSHANFASAVNAYRPMLAVRPDDVYLSFLPLPHVAERFIHALMITEGAAIGYYKGSVATLLEDAQELHPTFFAAVPRLMNRIFDQIQHKVNSSGDDKQIERFYQALEEKKRLGQRTHKELDAAVFDRFKPVLGGRVRQILTGAAPITSEVKEFFQYVFGVPVLEAYGITEASGAVACPTGDMPQGPHVGVPLPGIAIRLEDVPEMNYSSCDGHGEVVMKGPNVFSGYYKQPELTKEVLDADGWYATGDIGRWNEDGTLSIVDRKKHIFKLSQGEHVAPEKVEGVYLKSKFVSQVFVYGESLQSYLVAVVSPDDEVLKNSPWADWKSDLEQEKALEKEILRDMDIVAKADGLHGFERVRKLWLSREPFTVENDLVTPTLKPKRAKLTKYFAEEVKALYAAGML